VGVKILPVALNKPCHFSREPRISSHNSLICKVAVRLQLHSETISGEAAQIPAHKRERGGMPGLHAAACISGSHKRQKAMPSRERLLATKTGASAAAWLDRHRLWYRRGRTEGGALCPSYKFQRSNQQMSYRILNARNRPFHRLCWTAPVSFRCYTPIRRSDAFHLSNRVWRNRFEWRGGRFELDLEILPETETVCVMFHDDEYGNWPASGRAGNIFLLLGAFAH
jgi:hypothetical protein